MQLPERVGNGTPTDEFWVISFTGRDRPGLIRDILKEPALQNVNIVDMDQRVMQGIFVMSVVADFGSSRVSANVLEDWFRENAGSFTRCFALHNNPIPRDWPWTETGCAA